jgi:hypothetical protein
MSGKPIFNEFQLAREKSFGIHKEPIRSIHVVQWILIPNPQIRKISILAMSFSFHMGKTHVWFNPHQNRGLFQPLPLVGVPDSVDWRSIWSDMGNFPIFMDNHGQSPIYRIYR